MKQKRHARWRWLLLLAACMVVTVTLTACGKSSSSQSGTGDKVTTFKHAEKTARGKEVTFYGFGGNEQANKWVDEVVAPAMKKKYDIKVKRVPMDIDNILNKLVSIKQSGKTGNIDVIWINGENFYTAKREGLLYGPFANKVPSFKNLMYTNGHYSKYDFGTPIKGYEVPYGTAQLTFFGRPGDFDNHFPDSAQQLLEYAKAHPGKLTYTAPPEFTGSAFVRNVICNIVGYKRVYDAPATKAGMYKAIKPGLDYLNELKPYLWKQGKTYPTTTAQLDKMYAAHQINMDFSYSPTHGAVERDEHQFSADTQPFFFKKGNIANESYLAIANSSANKDAALLLINEMTSESAQVKKAEAKYGYSLPPFDYSKLTPQNRQKLESLYTNKGVPSDQELRSHQIPEVQAKKIAIIESLWKEHVLHGDN